MSLLAGGRNLPWRGRGGLLLNAVMFAFFAGLATASIVYLLAPKWNEAPVPLDAPRLPVSVAGVIYNIAPAAIRVPLQRRTGAQDRVDLAYTWPDLTAPDSHVAGSIARLFVTIQPAASSMLPSERLKSIYPRYAETPTLSGPGGLAVAPFRDDTPYQGEDLVFESAAPEHFLARCSRKGVTNAGVCLLERRIDGADITLRFPRDWLNDWQNVAGGIDKLIARLHPA